MGDQGDSLMMEMPFNADLEAVKGSGIVANGAITAFLDSALGSVIHDQFETFRKVVTLDLRVDYFEKPEPFSSLVTKARCLKISDQLVHVQADVYSGDETASIAHAVAVFSMVNIEKKP